MSEDTRPDWLRAWDPSKAAKVVPRSAWTKGQSGCPEGRPPGIVDRRARLTKMLGDDADAVVRKALDMAKEGDTVALGLVLARVAPPLKPSDEPVEFEFDCTAPMAQQARQVLQAVADGHLSLDKAKVLLDCIHGLAAIQNVDELASRIEALEAQQREQGATARGNVVEQA